MYGASSTTRCWCIAGTPHWTRWIWLTAATEGGWAEQRDVEENTKATTQTIAGEKYTEFSNYI